MKKIWNWLVCEWQWPSAALFAAVFLLIFLPPFVWNSGAAMALVAVQLPIYMLHQAEEHLGDRFRCYTNERIGGGREALTPGVTFWINSLGVWLVDIVALYSAWLISPSAGLVAAYLALLNGAAHIIQGMVLREYNPGLVTSVALFLPVGGSCVWVVGMKEGPALHVLGFLAALGVHAVIVAHVSRRLARLRKGAEPSDAADTR